MNVLRVQGCLVHRLSCCPRLLIKADVPLVKRSTREGEQVMLLGVMLLRERGLLVHCNCRRRPNLFISQDGCNVWEPQGKETEQRPSPTGLRSSTNAERTTRRASSSSHELTCRLETYGCSYGLILSAYTAVKGWWHELVALLDEQNDAGGWCM